MIGVNICTNSEDLLEHINNGGKTQQNGPYQEVAFEGGFETADQCFHHIFNIGILVVGDCFVF